MKDASAAEWFNDKEFTSDWVSQHLDSWRRATAHLQERRDVQILEIGAWEGRSTIAFLNLLPTSSVTTIDKTWNDEARERLRRFDRNLAPFGERITRIDGNSYVEVLPSLLRAGRSFDLIYIDGDHHREGVVADTILAWPMLRQGGVLIWDDYLLDLHLPSEERPRDAIDWSLRTFAGQYTIAEKNRQLIVVKERGEERERPYLTAARTPKNLWRFLTRQPLRARR